MASRRFSVVGLLFGLPAFCDGQTPALNKLSQPLVAPIKAPNGLIKVANGLIFNWNAGILDATNDQVIVFDSAGSQLVSFKVLGLVPAAKSVSIYDVAASPGRWIAAAAVYSKGPGTPGPGSLLCFDCKGSLISAFALSANRTARTVAADDQGNLWTMTGGSDDSSKVPLIVEYDSSGKVLHTYLTRADYPAHAKHSFSVETGFAHMGFGNGVV